MGARRFGLGSGLGAGAIGAFFVFGSLDGFTGFPAGFLIEAILCIPLAKGSTVGLGVALGVKALIGLG